MSAQPEHDTYEKPFWQVQGVFGSGPEPDFSYTIGLHDRGLPELHLWAQPDRGEDPGADWRLSMNDRGHLLNELARLALAGRLGVGTEIERRYDAGQTTLRFRIGEPADREVLEGPRSALSRHDEEEAASAYRAITADPDHARHAPRGWSLPQKPSFDPGQRFGPRTPVVLARAAQLWQADDDTLVHLLDAALLVEASGMSLTYPVSVAEALARRVGRTLCLDDLHTATHELVDWMTESPASLIRWRRVVRTFTADARAAGPHERERLARRCARLLHDLLSLSLSVEVVADVADTDLLLSAHGPWLCGLRGGDLVPDDAWAASPAVLDVVTELLARLDAETLGIVAGVHQIARTHGVTEAPGYDDLCMRLTGWALVSPAGCPWDPMLSSLPGWRPLLEAVPHGVIAPLKPLQEWATCLTSALTHRMRLSGEDIRSLAAPFRQDLPGLERRLNAAL
jgi:hypothetical protein